ncbi:MAG TPA: permease-like cell division protein FtsX [Steroidobacteraceae bacterium]|jgi:cell division transport system permease protein|nr:permease-like cell division protein FtsX [Steroidobacteraceae bacterium]
MVAYLTHHAQSLVGSIGRLARAPFATALTVLVIGLALALPLALGLFVSNAMSATGGFSGAVDVSVYFRPEVTLARVEELARTARARPGVAGIEVISSAEALKEFQQYSGFGAAVQALGANPLPNVLHVRPTAAASTPADLDALRHFLSSWPEVDLVQADAQWVLRFNAILELLRRVLGIAAAFLGVGVLAVIGNTIRLEIQGRRPEIEVVRLVGGSTGFIRRPFLYAGMLYGFGGAVLAWGMVETAVLVLSKPMAALAQLYGSSYSLSGPALAQVGIVLGAGLMLGWLGAWLAAARHLRGIEPRA